MEANTCRRDPLEQGDFFDHILSKRSGKLEKRRSTASAMLETITYMWVFSLGLEKYVRN